MLQSTLSRFEAAALLNTHINIAADHSDHKKDAAATKEDNSHRKHPHNRQRHLYTSSGTLNKQRHPYNKERHLSAQSKQQIKGTQPPRSSYSRRR
jgi:hypothetical protein